MAVESPVRTDVTGTPSYGLAAATCRRCGHAVPLALGLARRAGQGRSRRSPASTRPSWSA